MKVLVIGSGAREHTVAWKLASEGGVEEVICAPGNAGIAQISRCVPVDIEDSDMVLELAGPRVRRFHRCRPRAPARTWRRGRICCRWPAALWALQSSGATGVE